MTDIGVEVGPTTQPYSLTEAEFQSPPDEITPYKVGEGVNRENIIPYLTNSFRISMGMTDAHTTYTEWERINNGFDTKQSLKSFFSAGGGEVLTDQEKEDISIAFNFEDAHFPDMDLDDELEDDDEELDEETNVIDEIAVYTFLDYLRIFSHSNKPMLDVGPLKGMKLRDLVTKIKAEQLRRKAKKANQDHQ